MRSPLSACRIDSKIESLGTRVLDPGDVVSSDDMTDG